MPTVWSSKRCIAMRLAIKAPVTTWHLVLPESAIIHNGAWLRVHSARLGEDACELGVDKREGGGGVVEASVEELGVFAGSGLQVAEPLIEGLDGGWGGVAVAQRGGDVAGEPVE